MTYDRRSHIHQSDFGYLPGDLVSKPKPPSTTPEIGDLVRFLPSADFPDFECVVIVKDVEAGPKPHIQIGLISKDGAYRLNIWTLPKNLAELSIPVLQDFIKRIFARAPERA